MHFDLELPALPALVCLLGLLAAGCKESPPPAPPPAPASPHAAGLPAGHPPIPKAPRAPGSVSDAGPATVVAKGTVALAEGAAPAANATLFLAARAAGSGGKGPPILVKRYAAPALPLAFELTSADRMMPGAALPASLEITARLDADGDATSRGPGDLAATATTAEGGAPLELKLAAP